MYVAYPDECIVQKFISAIFICIRVSLLVGMLFVIVIMDFVHSFLKVSCNSVEAFRVARELRGMCKIG